MSRFCHKCGSANDVEARFCEACGTPMRPVPGLSSLASPDGPSPRQEFAVGEPAVRMRRTWSGKAWAAVLAGFVVLGGGAGAAAWLMSDPPPTGAALHLALAQAGDPPDRRLVCLTDGLPYDRAQLNIRESDTRTRTWLDQLVTAELFERLEVDNTGDSLGQPLAVYKARPALTRWVEGQSLCIAKGLGAGDVNEISPVQSRAMGMRTLKAVEAQAQWPLRDAAPWLSQPGMATAVLERLPRSGSGAWKMVEGQPVWWRPMVFSLADGHWIAGTMAQRSQAEPQLAADEAPVKTQDPNASDWFARFTAMFHTRSNIDGVWEVDTEHMAHQSGLGAAVLASMPDRMGQRIRIEPDAIEVAGVRTKAKITSEGDRYTIVPAGAPIGVVFKLLDAQTLEMQAGMLTIRYRKVN